MNYLKIIAAVFLILLTQSCYKDLDKKPSSLQVTPNTVADLQRLMDDQQLINANRPVLSELGADDYYTTTADWNEFDLIGKYGYIWDTDPFHGAEVNDWKLCYTTILHANVVLEKVNELDIDIETPAGRSVRGQAHFHRAYSFWLLAQLFCKPYDSDSAATNLGIPLRVASDPNALVPRATVQQTYNQIIQDLLNAKELLPATTQFPTRPSQVAADALLARVYLSMGDANNAWHYANQSLLQYSTLMDYNTIPNTSAPFKQFNEETIFYATMGGSSAFNISTHSPVDSTLYDSYNDNDLRKELFFSPGANNAKIFKGTYAGPITSLRFCGLTTAEVILIRAECYARKGMVTEAMNDLNTLLKKRWNDNVVFKPYQALNKEQALDSIRKERRKELIFRGIRWSDIRRFNVNEQNITLTRIINNIVYTLPPRDPRFVYPIPEQEFEKNPMPQNKR